jgi:hypothetical protein
MSFTQVSWGFYTSCDFLPKPDPHASVCDFLPKPDPHASVCETEAVSVIVEVPPLAKGVPFLVADVPERSELGVTRLVRAG